MSNIISKQSDRLSKVIENDRLCISNDLSDLILYDLKNLLSNYFNLEAPVKIRVDAAKNCYEITITTKADSIKPYGIIK